MVNPIRLALTPMIMKITEKPTTKLREWRNMERWLLVIVASNISGPARLARYTGTRGSTQGDRKDSNPAVKATKGDKCSIIYIMTVTIY